jgi:hypothetical protein
VVVVAASPSWHVGAEDVEVLTVRASVICVRAESPRRGALLDRRSQWQVQILGANRQAVERMRYDVSYQIRLQGTARIQQAAHW